jgi:formylglycine-generating enzyme required for sulfatase activity
VRRLVIPSGLMLLLLVLAACGGEAEKTPTPTPTSTARAVFPPPTPTPTPTGTPLPVGFSNRSWTPVSQIINGVEMMLVPGGCFWMGGENGGDNEKPVHEVCLDAFWIDRTEVTYARYAYYGLAEPVPNWTDTDRPYIWISWAAASDFCASWDARLPTEAEWEYAARGPEGWAYPWGNDFAADNVVYGGNSGGQTANVGSRAGGVSWVGALDMSGNVWEWVADGYGPYPAERQVNPTGPESGRARVVRGGAWVNSDSDSLRATYRGRFLPDAGFYFVGFRCARSASDLS